jgi:hypothetical protein
VPCNNYSQLQAPAVAGHNNPDTRTCISCNLNDLQSISLAHRLIQQLQQGLNHVWLVECAAASTSQQPLDFGNRQGSIQRMWQDALQVAQQLLLYGATDKAPAAPVDLVQLE